MTTACKADRVTFLPRGVNSSLCLACECSFGFTFILCLSQSTSFLFYPHNSLPHPTRSEWTAAWSQVASCHKSKQQAMCNEQKRFFQAFPFTGKVEVTDTTRQFLRALTNTRPESYAELQGKSNLKVTNSCSDTLLAVPGSYILHIVLQIVQYHGLHTWTTHAEQVELTW